MKNLFLLVFLLGACVLMGQVVDSARVAREVDSLIQLSRAATENRDFEKALVLNDAAESLAYNHFSCNSLLYGSCIFNHGRVCYFKGSYDEAEGYFIKSKDIREVFLGKQHPDYAAVLNNLGALYYAMGDYNKAEPYWVEALDIRESVLGKTHRSYISSLHNLAVLYMELGKYEQSETLYLIALTIQEQVLGKKSTDYAGTLEDYATLNREIGLYKLAEKLYLEALSLKEELYGKKHASCASVLDNLATTYKESGQFGKSEVLYNEAIAIRAETLGKGHQDYAASLNNLANLYTSINNYPKAEVLYTEVKNILEKTIGRQHLNFAWSLNNLAVLFKKMGKFNEAESYYQEVISIRELKLGKQHPDYAFGLSNLASLNNETGNYKKSEMLYQESISILEKTIGKTHPDYAARLNNLANTFANMGEYLKAELLYKEAYSIFERTIQSYNPDFIDCVENLAILYYESMDYKSADNYFIKASDLLKEKLKDAIRFQSEQELSNYITKFTTSQNLYFSFSCHTNNMETFTSNFNDILFYKGLLLANVKNINDIASKDSVLYKKLFNLKSYHRRLATEYAKPIADRKNVAELEEKANTLEKELRRSLPGFDRALTQVTWQDVQKNLKKSQAAIEFTRFRYYNPDPTDSILYAALVLLPKDTSPHFVYLCTEAQLNGVLSRWDEDNLVESPSAVYWPKQGEASLYSLLWQPLEPLLPKGTTVWYSPAGLLHRLNLDAIGISKYEALADHYQLQRIGSTRQIALPNTTEFTGKEAALFGGLRYESDTTALQKSILDLGLAYRSAEVEEQQPASPDGPRTVRDSTLKYLPQSLVEVQNIANALQKNGFTASTFTDFAGTEEAFLQMGNSAGFAAKEKKKSPRILHVASHGYFFPDPKEDSTALKNPLGLERHIPYRASDNPFIRSGLLLSGSEHAWRTGTPASAKLADGILTAADIAAMDLSNTELAVLSACETGLGDVESNEGVYGLQRAFKIAGTRYLIMSLWKVGDQASMELMTAFYAKWLDKNKPMSVPEAFRAAQAEMRKKYENNPYRWAGFVLVQ